MKDTTHLPLPRAIGGLALPAVAAFLLQNLYHVNDTWFLGRFGADATNAMGLFMMVSIANFGFILTLARGTQSLVGRRFGAGNQLGVQRALAQGLTLSGLVLVPLGLLEWTFAPELFTAMGGEGATVVEATAYLRRFLLFLPFLFASPVLEFSFQALGDTRTPMRLQITAVTLNTLLNALLVLPHEIVAGPDGTTWNGHPLPLPLTGEGSWSFGGWGVVGAATATGCSRMVSALLGFQILVRRRGLGELVRRATYRLDGSVAREILRVGLPAGSSTFLYAAVGFVLVGIIGEFGQDALGAYAIGFRGLEGMSFMVVLGFGVATATVAAHAVGAGDLERARAAGHVGTALCAGTMLVTTIVFVAVPGPLVGLFTEDPGIAAIAVGYLATMAWCQIPQAFEMVYGDAMAGAGSSFLSACVSIPGNVLRIPLALLAVDQGLGLQGVWWAVLASAVLKGLGMAVLYLSGRWERGMAAGQHMVDGA